MRIFSIIPQHRSHQMLDKIPYLKACQLFFLTILFLLAAPIGFTQDNKKIDDINAVLISAARPVLNTAFTDEVRTIGSSVAPDNVMIASTITEIITELHFKSGQKIKKGAKLISLSRKKIDADVAALQRRVKNHEKEFSRLSTLNKSGYLHEQEVDNLATELDISRQNLLKQQALQSEHTLRAPFDGLLGLRKISVGELVKAGDELVSILRFNPMYIDFSLPAVNINYININDKINIIDNQDILRTAKIIAFDNQVNPNTRSITVRAEVDNKMANIFSGQLFRISLAVKPRQALLIQEKALLQRAKQHFIYVIDEGKAWQREVTIGSRNKGWVEILNGLSADESYIAEGLLRIRNGVKISLKPTQSNSEQTQGP